MHLGDYVFVCSAYWFMCVCSYLCVGLCLTNSSVSDGFSKHTFGWGETRQTADRDSYIYFIFRFIII